MIAYKEKSPIELVFKPLHSVDYDPNIQEQIYQIANGRKFVANETYKKLFKNHWKSKFNIPEIKKEEESVRKDKKLIET